MQRPYEINMYIPDRRNGGWMRVMSRRVRALKCARRIADKLADRHMHCTRFERVSRLPFVEVRDLSRLVPGRWDGSMEAAIAYAPTHIPDVPTVGELGYW